MRPRPWIVLLAIALAAGPALGGAVLDPKESPEWKVSEWINGDPGQLGGHKGRVVVVLFFQMWCPGSNKNGLPALEHWNELWGERDDYLGVAIHSVFEGQPFQTPELLHAFVRDKRIRFPVGIDAYAKPEDKVPVSLKRFDAKGTPHLVIIDKEGDLVFSHFGVVDVPMVEFYIDRLLKEETDYKPPAKPVRVDSTLSGTYDMQIEQVTRSCGPLEPPRQMTVRLEVNKDTIDADFPYSYWGLEGLSLKFDSHRLVFEGVLEREAEIRGEQVSAEARIRGKYVLNSYPPALEFEVMFTKRSPKPEMNCEVRSRGTGVRTGD